MPELYRLLILDPKSGDFADLLRSFLSSGDNRKAILELPEEDAKVLIESIYRVRSS